MIMTRYRSPLMVSLSTQVRFLCRDLRFVCDVNYPDVNGLREVSVSAVTALAFEWDCEFYCTNNTF